MSKKRKVIYVDLLILCLVISAVWSMFLLSGTPLEWLEFPIHRLTLGWKPISILILIGFYLLPISINLYILWAVQWLRWRESMKILIIIPLLTIQLCLCGLGAGLMVVASHGLRFQDQMNFYQSPRNKYSLDMRSSSDGCNYRIYQNRDWYQTYVDDIELSRRCNFEEMNWKWNADETQLIWRSVQEGAEDQSGIVDLKGS